MFRRSETRKNEYATRIDFQQIFTEDITGLHQLALLLTADAQKAEECVVAGLEDSISGNHVFKQWARSWAKRAIIKRAIQAVSPSNAVNGKLESLAATGDARRDQLIAAVSGLEPLDRFVFVIAVLEGYTLAECAALLAVSAPQVIAAKTRALEKMTAVLKPESVLAMYSAAKPKLAATA
jgi:DNA-directed RNA polymerase specialized sigma24 family protein